MKMQEEVRVNPGEGMMKLMDAISYVEKCEEEKKCIYIELGVKKGGRTREEMLRLYNDEKERIYMKYFEVFLSNPNRKIGDIYMNIFSFISLHLNNMEEKDGVAYLPLRKLEEVVHIIRPIDILYALEDEMNLIIRNMKEKGIVCGSLGLEKLNMGEFKCCETIKLPTLTYFKDIVAKIGERMCIESHKKNKLEEKELNIMRKMPPMIQKKYEEFTNEEHFYKRYSLRMELREHMMKLQENMHGLESKKRQREDVISSQENMHELESKKKQREKI